MKSIKEIFSAVKDWVRTDGLLHIETSAIIVLVAAGTLNVFTKKWIAMLCAVLVALVIGLLKEVYDRVSGKGTAEWHDVICDCVGVALASIYCLLL